MLAKFLSIFLLTNQFINIEGPLNIEISYRNNYSNLSFANDFFKFDIIKEDYNVYYEPEINFNKIGFTNEKIFIETSSNKSGWTYFLLNIIDDIPPIIKGPNKLIFSNKNIPNIDEILSYYISEDEIDGKCDIYFEDIFDSNTKNITLKSKDKSNNIAIKEIKILYQNQQSYWLIDNPILTISNRDFIPANKIIEKLMQEQMLESFSFIYARYNDDYYCNNYFVTGIFETSIDIYLYTQVDPLTIDFSLNIISEDNNFFIQKESHWWDSIINFFKNIIQKIKSLFSR